VSDQRLAAANGSFDVAEAEKACTSHPL